MNGKLDASGTYSVPVTSHDRALMFGKSLLSQSQAFDGLIDEVKIWDRALSSTEVADLASFDTSLASTSWADCLTAE